MSYTLPPLALPSYGPGGIYGEGDNPAHIIAMLERDTPYGDQSQGYWSLYAPERVTIGAYQELVLTGDPANPTTEYRWMAAPPCYFENGDSWNGQWLCPDPQPVAGPSVDDELVDRLNRRALHEWFRNAALDFVRHQRPPSVEWINTLPQTHPRGAEYQALALELSKAWPDYVKQGIADSQPDSFSFFKSPIGMIWMAAAATITGFGAGALLGAGGAGLTGTPLAASTVAVSTATKLGLQQVAKAAAPAPPVRPPSATATRTIGNALIRAATPDVPPAAAGQSLAALAPPPAPSGSALLGLGLIAAAVFIVLLNE